MGAHYLERHHVSMSSFISHFRWLVLAGTLPGVLLAAGFDIAPRVAMSVKKFGVARFNRGAD
jgi:hypothetical protein